jgi:hypothetical protein
VVPGSIPGLARHYHLVAAVGKLLTLDCLAGVRSSALEVRQLVRVYCVYNPVCTVVHVRHLRLSSRLFVRANCGVLVVLLK